jgi:hypothetical protein
LTPAADEAGPGTIRPVELLSEMFVLLVVPDVCDQPVLTVLVALPLRIPNRLAPSVEENENFVLAMNDFCMEVAVPDVKPFVYVAELLEPGGA